MARSRVRPDGVDRAVNLHRDKRIRGVGPACGWFSALACVVLLAGCRGAPGGQTEGEPCWDRLAHHEALRALARTADAAGLSRLLSIAQLEDDPLSASLASRLLLSLADSELELGVAVAAGTVAHDIAGRKKGSPRPPSPTLSVDERRFVLRHASTQWQHQGVLDPVVREAAFRVLAQASSPGREERLSEGLADSRVHVRRVALHFWAREGAWAGEASQRDPAMIEQLLEFARSADRLFALDAARLAAEFDLSTQLPLVLSAVAGPVDEGVREILLQAVMDSRGSPPARKPR